ncbi:MAG: helix-turn-helix domain-containing protein, partial [Planctomycetota bacterium]
MSISQRLKYARDKMKLTLEQVEERSRIGKSSLSEFEHGKREPRLSQLQTLADVYRRSISFFLEEGELPKEFVLWRQIPDHEAAPEIKAQFLRLCQQYYNLEVWCNEHLHWNLPKIDKLPDTFHYSDAEDLAYQVRIDLQLGDRPGQGLLRVLEEVCGIKVFHLAFEPTGSAACSVNNTGAAILLNTNHVRWRRNFDLAHELFHILTWHIFHTNQDDDAVNNEKEEKFASCFAGNLLMPTDTVRHAINQIIVDNKIAFADMFNIARQFDVSVDALCWRMGFLKIFDFEKIPEMIDRYRLHSAKWERGRERDNPPQRPLRFSALATKALREGNISLGRF